MHPDPIPTSKMFKLVFFFVKLRILSTSNSVSGRGIKVSLVTKNSEFQKNFLPVIYAIGSPIDLCLINFGIN